MNNLDLETIQKKATTQKNVGEPSFMGLGKEKKQRALPNPSDLAGSGRGNRAKPETKKNPNQTSPWWTILVSTGKEEPLNGKAWKSQKGKKTSRKGG